MFTSEFGEFILRNIFQIISLLIIIIGGIVAFTKLQSSVENLKEKQKEMTTEFQNFESDVKTLTNRMSAHEKDTDSHVNHLHMRSIDDRLKKLEGNVEKGFEKLGDKFDSFVEKVLLK